MLLEEFDPTKKAVIDPEKTVDKIKDFPPITISVFSKTLIIEELWDYAKNVFKESNEWLLSITYDDLKIKYSKLDEERIQSTNTVAKSENWLIEYWCSKDIKGLLGMPFSRHWIMHLEASLRIKNKLIE